MEPEGRVVNDTRKHHAVAWVLSVYADCYGEWDGDVDPEWIVATFEKALLTEEARITPGLSFMDADEAYIDAQRGATGTTADALAVLHLGFDRARELRHRPA